MITNDAYKINVGAPTENTVSIKSNRGPSGILYKVTSNHWNKIHPDDYDAASNYGDGITRIESGPNSGRFTTQYAAGSATNYYITTSVVDSITGITASDLESEYTSFEAVPQSNVNKVYKGSNLIWYDKNSHVYVSGTTRVSGQGGTLPSFGYNTDIKTFSIIGDTLATLPDQALETCAGLTTANLGSSITGIGERAFYGCSSLTSVAIPPTVKLIDDSAFENCSNITGYQIPDSVTGVKDTVFANNNSLTEIRFGTGLYSVGSQAARGVNTLTGLYFAQSGTYGGLNRITSQAFENCTGLESIRVPSGITLLDDSCFKGCSNLKVIRIMSENPPTFDSTFAPFANTDSNAKIYVKLADSANWASTFAGLDVEAIITPESFDWNNQTLSQTVTNGQWAGTTWSTSQESITVVGTTATTWHLRDGGADFYFIDPRTSSATADVPWEGGSDWIRGQTDSFGNIVFKASGFSLGITNVKYSETLDTGVLSN